MRRDSTRRSPGPVSREHDRKGLLPRHRLPGVSVVPEMPATCLRRRQAQQLRTRRYAQRQDTRAEDPGAQHTVTASEVQPEHSLGSQDCSRGRVVNSSDIISDLCEITGDVDTLDLTYGQGVFWRKFKPESLTANDMYVMPNDGLTIYQTDFMSTPLLTGHWSLVVFDPPFTANGPSKNPHNERYRSHRDQAGAPQNVKEVRSLLVGGIKEACRISNKWVIVKTQDVVESGQLHANVVLALNTLVKCGFNIHTEIPFTPSRRPQPSGRRVTGLGGRPSVFMLARKNVP